MGRKFFLRRNLARLGLRLSRWHTVGTVPSRGILVGAPHTSNWDWVLTMFLAWDSNVQIRLLVKESFFRGPLAPFLRWTGAVELDRDNPGATIKELLADAKTDETFLLGIAAEGTRSKGDTGSPASTASRGRPASRSPWPSSTRPPGRWGGGRRS